jgi:hypothetical protein
MMKLLWESPAVTTLPLRATAYDPGNSADAPTPVRPGWKINRAPAAPENGSARADKPGAEANGDWEAPRVQRTDIANI